MKRGLSRLAGAFIVAILVGCGDASDRAAVATCSLGKSTVCSSSVHRSAESHSKRAGSS